MADSNVETIKGLIVGQLEAISTAAGYRTDVVAVYQVPINIDQHTEGFPVISVLAGKERVAFIDANKTSSHSVVDIACVGYVSSDTKDVAQDAVMADAGEPLIHDMKRVLAAYILANITADPVWQIIALEGQTAFEIERFLIPGTNKGFVGIRFTVQIFAQDNDY